MSIQIVLLLFVSSRPSRIDSRRRRALLIMNLIDFGWHRLFHLALLHFALNHLTFSIFSDGQGQHGHQNRTTIACACVQRCCCHAWILVGTCACVCIGLQATLLDQLIAHQVTHTHARNKHAHHYNSITQLACYWPSRIRCHIFLVSIALLLLGHCCHCNAWDAVLFESTLIKRWLMPMRFYFFT